MKSRAWIREMVKIYCVFVLGVMVGYGWACYHYLNLGR